MRKFSPENERIKHRYFAFLSDAKRLSADTIDLVAAAISDFEHSTGHKDFRLFRLEQAQSYKRRLSEANNRKSGRPLAKATISTRLAALKAFFQWLTLQPGFKSRLNYSHAEYFNASATDERIAKARQEKPVASIEQFRHVLNTMPTATETNQRDRALIAFTLLSGARDDAIASLSLRHVDLDARRVHQNPKQGVRTKASKTINSKFFPVGQDIETIVREWIHFLINKKKFGPDDPLFPASKSELGESGHFESGGLDRKHWKSATAIRRIFRTAFESSGLPYFNPHSVRDTLAMLGEKRCLSIETFKAWSQNLGHEKVLTTLTSYGKVSQYRQDEIFEAMANEVTPENHRPTLIAVDRERLERLEGLIAGLAAKG